MLITEWLDYYKRVTFLSVHMPGHCREFGSFPEPKPLTKKDLPDLASINPHDPGIWAYVLITEWLNYYKRVTFLSVHMPGHRREFGSIPELMPVTKKDLPDLASVQASMTQVIGLFGSMCSSLNDFVTISV